MNSPIPSCPKCGRETSGGANFCPSCGAALAAGKPAVPARPRSVPVPDRSGLHGRCAVIYAGEGEMDARRVGRLVAEAVARPLPDVTRDLRNSKGFIARGLEAPVAVALADKAERELGAPILVIPEEECVPLPEVMRMRDPAVDADGLRCEAYTWDRTERVSARWDEIFLIACGRIEIQHAVVAAEEDANAESRLVGGRAAPMVMEKRHEFVLEVVLFEPWRRLRLDQNPAGFSLTEMRRGPDESLGPLYRCALGLNRFAQGVPVNRGLQLLSGGAPDAVWEPLTFLNKRDFETYTSWLMQLVRYGRAIPA